jgi:anti-sigma B factor antagonist
MRLVINAREERGVVILGLSGRLVMGDEVKLLREQIRSLLAEHKKMILLNMAEVAYVDSSGIGTLVEGVVLTTTEGGRLKLANLQRMVYSALALHKLTPAFQIFSSEEEALSSFESPGQPAGPATEQK